MYELVYPLLFLISLITVVYFVSRQSINLLYITLKRIFRRDGFVYAIISIIYFPGTILHELSHAFMARILLLKVVEIKLLPEWKHKSIKLGMVTYIRRDTLSSIIVGIAPIFGGIALLIWLASLNIFPNSDMRITAALGYLIVVISSTMFSSQQDLVDAAHSIPFILIILVISYFIYTSFDLSSLSFIVPLLHTYIIEMNHMLLISLSCHLVALFILYCMKLII